MAKIFKEIKYLRYINSDYIKKDLFSFLDENKKLSKIIYNKKFQKIIGVNLEYYKKISGKNREVDKSGNGREYLLNTNKMIFEGTYLNGKKNGKGIYRVWSIKI